MCHWLCFNLYSVVSTLKVLKIKGSTDSGEIIAICSKHPLHTNEFTNFMLICI